MTVDLYSARPALQRFLGSGLSRDTLALVYGRRRIGHPTLLSTLATDRGGFCWEDALQRLLALGAENSTPVILDEFGYVLESEPGLDSIIATLHGPSRRRERGGARLVLCSSAMAMMRKLTDGQAPLRGRAALGVVMQPLDYRAAAQLMAPIADLMLATRVFAVVGGVVSYATDMVDDDLPRDLDDFPRWVAERVLSPAATLHHEATTLLAEDPTLAAANQTLHHSILGVLANGAVTAGAISNRLRKPVSNLDPALKRLAAAGFVVRHKDPIRGKPPVYALADPFLQFIMPCLSRLRRCSVSAIRETHGNVAWPTSSTRMYVAPCLKNRSAHGSIALPT
ncbi:MAG: winged helix-turn-helix transcriptional regulator [Gemmatimonas sp.]|nr:winged helix-turn-helix transcriptional regulator [Gemmatimonas sp.]